ncbi:MAG TPA: ABC transporter permease [Rhodospirillaceae bacterium]|nr:ABC transporter permease [Rhodospirillaceae bacterium]
MIRFLGQRLFEALVVLFLMSFAIYGLIGLMPGDPIDLMINADPKLTPDDAARLKALYGLDRPIVERYWNWLVAALGGDLGFSRVYTKPVMEILVPRLGSTALLLGISLSLSLAIAIPLGVYAALNPYSKADYAVNMFCFAGISLPPFWLALLLILCFAVVLGWLPAGGMLTVGDGGILDRLQYMILPVLTLTIHSVGGFTRFMRASMMETLRQDYVRTARAKGLSEARVVTGHALRNALTPLVTVVALSFGGLFSGALITETMFGWRGMGKTIFDAIMGNDFNLALVGLLLATGFTLLGNFLADLCYAWLDPRVTLSEEREP